MKRRKLFEHLERILKPDDLLQHSSRTLQVKIIFIRRTFPFHHNYNWYNARRLPKRPIVPYSTFLAECLKDERNEIEEPILIAPKYADEITLAVTDVETQIEQHAGKNF